MYAPVFSRDGYRIYGYPESLNVIDLSVSPPTETRLPTPSDNNMWASSGVGVVYR